MRGFSASYKKWNEASSSRQEVRRRLLSFTPAPDIAVVVQEPGPLRARSSIGWLVERAGEEPRHNPGSALTPEHLARMEEFWQTAHELIPDVSEAIGPSMSRWGDLNIADMDAISAEGMTPLGVLPLERAFGDRLGPEHATLRRVVEKEIRKASKTGVVPDSLRVCWDLASDRMSVVRTRVVTQEIRDEMQI